MDVLPWHRWARVENLRALPGHAEETPLDPNYGQQGFWEEYGWSGVLRVPFSFHRRV